MFFNFFRKNKKTKQKKDDPTLTEAPSQVCEGGPISSAGSACVYKTPALNDACAVRAQSSVKLV